MKLLTLLFSIITMGVAAQSNVYEFNSLTEKDLIKNKEHKEKGLYSVNISKDESRMTIYWDLKDLSERVDFDLLYKRDTTINKRKYILHTAMSQALKDYNIYIFYPVQNSADVRELHVVDKQVNTYYIFK